MKHISPNQLWTQQPVGSRLVEVNTKTGFSLTAGSYSVLESATVAIVDGSTSTTATATIASVSLTQSKEGYLGYAYGNATNVPDGETLARIAITGTTTLTMTRGRAEDPLGTCTAGWVIQELF
jgi:hypothetical protein